VTFAGPNDVHHVRKALDQPAHEWGLP